jgi:peptidoglycan/LPS O-acetylase OafA/YrhL
VELFFGISGMVIVAALPRAKSLSTFAWDRFTRIYPVLWITLIVIIGLSIAAHDPRKVLTSPIGVAANFLTPPPFFRISLLNPAAWSLGYELTFYLLCGIAWAFRPRAPRLWLPAAILVGIALTILFPRGILIGAGALIANGLLNWAPVKRAAAFPSLALVGFLSTWAFLNTLTPDGIMYFSPVLVPFVVWVRLLPLLLLGFLFGSVALLGISEGRGVLSRFLRTRPMLWAGTVSYSFYLWHPVVMGVVKNIMYRTGIVSTVGGWSQLVFAVLALPVSLVLAHFSQIWVEGRLTRWLRGLGPGGSRAKAPITASVEASAIG